MHLFVSRKCIVVELADILDHFMVPVIAAALDPWLQNVSKGDR